MTNLPMNLYLVIVSTNLYLTVVSTNWQATTGRMWTGGTNFVQFKATAIETNMVRQEVVVTYHTNSVTNMTIRVMLEGTNVPTKWKAYLQPIPPPLPGQMEKE